jgi:hypothetical protein
LAKRGVKSQNIMRLGRWEAIAMLAMYTNSVRFGAQSEEYKG